MFNNARPHPIHRDLESKKLIRYYELQYWYAHKHPTYPLHESIERLGRMYTNTIMKNFTDSARYQNPFQGFIVLESNQT